MKKNVRETSLMAYIELKEGKMGKLQSEVYEIIKNSPFPVTDREIIEVIGIEGNTIRPRRNELQKLDLIEEAGKRRCSISGKLALTWKAKECKQLFEVKDENTLRQLEGVPVEDFRELSQVMAKKGFKYRGNYEWVRQEKGN